MLDFWRVFHKVPDPEAENDEGGRPKRPSSFVLEREKEEKIKKREGLLRLEDGVSISEKPKNSLEKV